jgi:hypothetical protein
MSTTATVAHTAGPATQAIRRTEGDLTDWLRDVIDGNGSSPAQMVLTAVLGCVPYVGQALDARNIILALIALADEPDSSERWLDLVLSLIALVPGFGDALKNVFKLLRMGKPLGRILDALPNTLRGNVEKWFRTLDWAHYTRELSGVAESLLAKLIGVLDGWVTRAVMGNARVKQVVAQLQRLQTLTQARIDEAMQGLKAAHAKALGDPLPATTAHAPAVAKTPAKTPPPGSGASGNVKMTSGGTHTPAQGNANASHRQSPPKKTNHRTGASAEHITDYYFVRRNKNRSKVSNLGTLWEYQQPGHTGIDHVWHHARLPFGYRITDTKGTSSPRHRLMTPKAFYDAARQGIDIFIAMEDETSIRNATPKPTVGDGKEMSHTWVVRKIPESRLNSEHRLALEEATEKWRFEFSKDATGKWRLSGKAPYDRSFVTVIASNIAQHDNSNGGDVPRCSRPVKAHQVAAEFILPTEIYFE